MKSKHLFILIPLLIAVNFLCHPMLLWGEEPQPAEKVEAPAETKAEAPVAEKEAEKPAEDSKEDEASKLWNPSLWEVVGGIIAIIWGFIVVRFKLKEGKKKKITMAFEAAVQDTYTEFIRPLKAGKGDGKLTKGEVKKAQQTAWNKAGDILQNQGINLGKEVIAEYGPVLVTKIVQLFKKKKKD